MRDVKILYVEDEPFLGKITGQCSHRVLHVFSHALRTSPRRKVRKLSAREADLLKILLENRHFTVARKDILMRVWGDDHLFNSRSLDVYITKLRDYLREDPNIQIITIKGVGYHFNC